MYTINLKKNIYHFLKYILVDSYKIKDKKGKESIREVKFEIRFIDTLGFLPASISTLAENLKKDCKTIKQLRGVFKNISNNFKNDQQFELMISKGVYPYEYIDKYEKLNETQLPHKNCFIQV